MATPNFENDQPVYIFSTCLWSTEVCQALWRLTVVATTEEQKHIVLISGSLLKKYRNLVIYMES